MENEEKTGERRTNCNSIPINQAHSLIITKLDTFLMKFYITTQTPNSKSSISLIQILAGKFYNHHHVLDLKAEEEEIEAAVLDLNSEDARRLLKLSKLEMVKSKLNSIFHRKPKLIDQES